MTRHLEKTGRYRSDGGKGRGSANSLRGTASMRRKLLLLKAFIATCFVLLAPAAARAACPALPATISNGQVADATALMNDLNSILNCATTAIAPSGTPTTGSLAKFITPGTIGTGNLSGDVTTSGSLATTLANSGVTAGTYACPTVIFDAKGRATTAASGNCSGGSGSGPAPTLVQYAGVRGTSNSQGSYTATLGTTPTTGDLLISLMAGYFNASDMNCPTGFSSAYSAAGVLSNQGVLVCARIAQAGDGKSYTGTTNDATGAESFLVFEFVGAKGLQATATPIPFSGSSLSFLGMPLGDSSYTIGVAESDHVNSYSSISNAPLLFDGSGSNGGSINHPAVIFRLPSLNTVGITYGAAPDASALLAFISIIG